jgi:translation initiation factor 1A
MPHEQKKESFEKEDFGDFEEIKDESQTQETPAQNNFPTRIRMPRNKELIGIITQRYGGNRMEVLCTDGKTRNCRVPGKHRRNLWLRPKNFVIITPWDFDDEKGDIIYKYNPGDVFQLRKRGMINNLKEEF